MKPIDIYFLCGQGDAATSPGILDMGHRMRQAGRARVRTYYWWQWANMLADIDTRKSVLDLQRLAVGYSMGANALTWVLGGVMVPHGSYPGVRVPFDYAIFLDPTHLSNITPLGKYSKQALHYHNTWPLTPFGHGIVTCGPGFDPSNLEVVETTEDHLLLDLDLSIQQRIMDELNRRILGLELVPCSLVAAVL